MPRSNWTSRIILTTDAPEPAASPAPALNASAKELGPVTLNRRQSLARPAFTTIELLIAMSIIVLLAGLVFVGFRAVGAGGKTRSSRNTLETAKSLMNEVQIAKGMPYVKAVYASPPNGSSYLNMFPPLATGAIPNALPAPILNNNGDMTEDGYTPTHNIRFKSDAVLRTQMVMARCQNIAANRTTISQLPAGSLLRWTPSTAPTINGNVGQELQVLVVSSGGSTKYTISPPVLIDAWNNPIIYVPPAGLRGVYFSADTNNYANKTSAFERVVTSVKVRTVYAVGDKFEPGATGFWASAGADGDFTKGDDNIYSFEGF